VASDHLTLVNRYLRTIRRKGVASFEETELKELEDEERTGVVTNTSAGDESTTIRRSPVPIDQRIAAAEQALEHFENGTVPGIKRMRVNRGNSIAR